MATTTTVDTDRPPPPLRLDSIPTVDLRLLSQSELYSLSKCSKSSFDLNRCDDVVIPKIDRSVFNESAGSRKQTYSRLRLAPADSSTSTKTTMHRRTPHLRLSHAPTSNNINDPEQAENTQIVRMLKELFNSDPNLEDLVPIEVQNDFVPNEIQNDFVRNEIQNDFVRNEVQNDFVPIEVQNDTKVVVPELLNPEMKRKRGRPRKHENAGVISPPITKRMRDSAVKKVVEFNNDRDTEIVNFRGVKINVANLGRLEDPYGPEIRRRTKGMLTEDELLGFLGGLNGQWVTSRKKKRVVDASDFGDALPKGWRLILSIKKRVGRVWLFCRRYISPSGRQFESCKEASMYLLSILGEEKLDKPNQTHSKDCDDFALKGASGNAADLSVREDLKRINSVHIPSALPTSLHTDREKQVLSANSHPVVEQVEELFKCLKCFMIFEGKMSLSNHQVLVHKYERSDIGSTISDFTIVIGGIFECQLCHKTFSERSQYNGHIAMHVTNENKTAEASEAPTAEKTNDPLLYPGVSAEGNVEIETHDARYGDKLISASPQSDHKLSSSTELKTNEHFCDLNILAHGTQGGHVNMNGDVLVENSGDEIGKNCNVAENEVSVSKSDLCFDHEPSSAVVKKDVVSNGRDAVSGTGVTHVDDKPECIPVVGEFASVDVLNHSVSETGVQTSSVCGKRGFRTNINDMLIFSSFDKSTSEKEKVVNNESSSGVFHGVSLDSYNVSSMDGGTRVEKERNLISRSSVSSWCKKGLNEDVGRKVLISTMEEPRTQMTKENFHIENDVNNASSNKSGEANLDDFQVFRNNESKNNEVASMRSSQNGLNAGVMAFNTGKNLEFCSLAPPGNEQAFGFQDDVTGLYDNAAHQSSERGLLNHFCVAETSDDIFGNKLYSTPLDGLKFGEERNIDIHELSLAFGNPHGLYADTISVEQKKDGLNRSAVPSKIEEAFDVQTNLSMVNNSMVEDLKGGRESVGGSFSLSCNNERAFQDNGNTVYSGRTWEDLRSDEFRSSERKKFMIGSSSNQRQLNEVVPSGMWKTDDRNQLQSGSANPHTQIQSPSCFHSFDIMSDKAEDGLFRVDERYKDGSSIGGVRSEPREFRFLTGESEHNLQGDSRVFPYNTGMEQAFDSPFWMGKNSSMMPAARNLVTSLCSWCRNEFHFHPQTQAGIGSLCPACSAGISGQVNML